MDLQKFLNNIYSAQVLFFINIPNLSTFNKKYYIFLIYYFQYHLEYMLHHILHYNILFYQEYKYHFYKQQEFQLVKMQTYAHNENNEHLWQIMAI